MSDLITAKLLPFSILNQDLQLKVAENSQPMNVTANETIFTKGDIASHSFYLLKGKAKLTLANGKTVSRGPSALPLSQGYEQYNLSATTETDSVILRVDFSPRQQDEILCWEIAGRYFDNADWVFAVKDCTMFEHIQPYQILSLLQHFQHKDTTTNELLTNENAYEREFYILNEGKAEVFQGAINEDSQAISEILPMQSFGEASLMEDLPRTASIKVSEPGSVKVLNAESLETITQKSLPNSCFKNASETKEAIAKGAKLLDIRPSKEASLSPLKQATGAAIDQTPESLGSLSNDESYIIYSPYQELNKMVYLLLAEENPEVSIHKV